MKIKKPNMMASIFLLLLLFVVSIAIYFSYSPFQIIVNDIGTWIAIQLFNLQTYLIANNLFNRVSYLSIAVTALSLVSIFSGYCAGRRWEAYRKKITKEEIDSTTGGVRLPMGEPKTTIRTEAPVPVAKEETAK